MTFCRGQLLEPENFFNTGVYFWDVNSFWFMTPVEVWTLEFEPPPLDGAAEAATVDDEAVLAWFSIALRFLEKRKNSYAWCFNINFDTMAKTELLYPKNVGA